MLRLAELLAWYRRQKLAHLLMGASLLVVLVYFYKLSTADYGQIIVEVSRQSDDAEVGGGGGGESNRQMGLFKSSIIIEAIVGPNSEAESKQLQRQQESPPVRLVVTEFRNGVYFYNMSESVESWWPFECVKTRMRQSVVNVRVCIHEPRFDRHLSAQLKLTGLWEPTNVRSFLRTLAEIGDANVLDIGANVGLYSLLAAKLGRHVIAVEPLHDNLNRMHKAAHLEHVQSRIIALVNALSNQRQPLKLSSMSLFVESAFS